MRRDRVQGPKSGVLPIIRQVRRRWRLRQIMTGAAVVLAVGLAAFVFFAWGLELLRFSPGAVVGLRTAAWALLAGLAGWFVLRPLLRRVNDEQVALYLEEHEPSLQDAILGAVSAERLAGAVRKGAAAPPHVSDAFLGKLVESAVEKARAVEYGRRIEQRPLYRSTGILGAVAFAALALLLLAPPGVRHGMSALLVPTRDAAETNPYSIQVTPGDVTVARGSDQFVGARLGGFRSEDVSLFIRGEGGEAFQRLSMLPMEDAEGFELLLFNLQEETSYFVESNGVRSRTHRIRVEDLPYVERMEHEYRFPSYTGLEPRHVEPGRDIAALRGTVVRVTVHATMATPGGRLLVDEERSIPLAAGEDGMLSADLEVRERGLYRIELEAPNGRLVSASPTYTIDVLRDLEPSVRFVRPGRDTPASAIEEVYLEARADDDYGVAQLFIAFSVNGAPEDTVSLYAGGGIREVTAGHTLFLEEWDLEPGDVVTYYAVARDNDRPAGGKEVKSDLYFINIRPFGREYRQADQMGGGQPQGGGQGGPETALSELQRQVIAATFNLARDRERYDARTFDENATSVALAQGRVRAQVSTLVERMTARGLSNADPRFREIAELLPQAVRDMETAEARLRAGEVQEALTPEQLALRVLLRAEETYERFVGEQRQGGGGGGGDGQGPNAEDLADLFELELDKLRNQYETVQRGQRREADNEVDELLERLKDLARRQQQEAERQRRSAAQQQGGGGSASDAQRALAEETEEAARRLERLAREQSDERLAETARRLQQAADAMRRSTAQSSTGRLAEVASALDRLDEAQRRLERARENRAADAAQDAQERARRLAESQRQVQEELNRLAPEGQQRSEQLRRLVERKEEMFRETQDLEAQLDRLAGDLRRESPEVGRALSEAADQIRDSRLADKIAFSRGVVQQRDTEFARQFEEQIAQDIAELERRVRGAAAATSGNAEGRELDRALERAQDLVRGVESLEQRMAESGQEQGQGERGDPQGDAQAGQEGDRRLERGDEGRDGQQAGGGGRGVGGEEPAGQAGGAFDRGDGGPTWGGGPRGGLREFTPEEIRQYQREFTERLQEATELRRQLVERGEDVTELDRSIAMLRQLQEARLYADLPQVALLQESLRQSLRQVEFAIRRQVEGEGVDRVFLSGSDGVPEGFRRLVEEYYRSLARQGGGG